MSDHRGRWGAILLAALALAPSRLALAQCDQGVVSGCRSEGAQAAAAEDYGRAVQLFHRGCENADEASCALLLETLAAHPDARASVPQLWVLLFSRCERGDDAMCGQLGRDAFDGADGPEVARRVLPALAAACDRDVGAACAGRGAIVGSQRGRRAQSEASAYFTRACRLQDGRGCRRLGELFEERDPSGALARFTQGCGLDDAVSCGRRGRLLAPADPAAAAPLLERGCDAGDAESCVSLGRLNEQRLFPGATDEAAERAFASACQASDHPEACGRLGQRMHARGDDSGAEPLLRTACTGRWAYACATLGDVLSARGDRGARRVYRQAQAALSRDCRRGDGEACLGIAALYRDGRGVRPSEARARDWAARGCAAGAGDRARCLELGVGLAASRSRRAQPILATLCNGGEARACAALAPIAPRRQREAIYRRACELGEAAACEHAPGAQLGSAIAAVQRAPEPVAGQRVASEAAAAPPRRREAAEVVQAPPGSHAAPPSAAVVAEPRPQIAAAPPRAAASSQAEPRVPMTPPQATPVPAPSAASPAAPHVARTAQATPVLPPSAASPAAPHVAPTPPRVAAQATPAAPPSAASPTAPRVVPPRATARATPVLPPSASSPAAPRVAPTAPRVAAQATPPSAASPAGSHVATPVPSVAQNGGASAVPVAPRSATTAEATTPRAAATAEPTRPAQITPAPPRVAAQIARAPIEPAPERAGSTAALSSSAGPHAQSAETDAAARAREAEERARAQRDAAVHEAEERARAQRDAAVHEAEQRARVQREAAVHEAEERARVQREAAVHEAEERARTQREAAVREAEQRARAAAAHEAEQRARAAAAHEAEERARAQREAAAREAEARREAREAARARAAAEARAAREAQARRRAEQAAARERQRADAAAAREREAQQRAAAREAEQQRLAAEAREREAAQQRAAREAAEREAAARREAEARADAERRAALARAEREARAHREAQQAAERARAARTRAEQAAARERAAREQAEQRLAEQQRRAQELAARAAEARRQAEEREQQLARSVREAQQREEEARRREAEQAAAREATARREAAERAAAAEQRRAEREAAAHREATERAAAAEQRRAARTAHASSAEEEAAAALERVLGACDSGESGMCERAGVTFRDGAGVTADPERALYYFELACTAGTGSACAAAIPLVPEDDGARLARLHAGVCASGDADACERGLSLVDESETAEPLRARLATIGCALGRPAACVVLGDARRAGRGIERDRQSATESYARACTSEQGEGCSGVSALCREGWLEACELLAGACDAGVAAACGEIPEGDASRTSTSDAPHAAETELSRRAHELRRRGDDAAAAALLDAERAREDAPWLSAELALAYAGSAQPVAAERHLRAALAAESDGWVEEHRAALELALRYVDASLGWVVVECTVDGADVRAVGSSAESVPCGEPLRVGAGEQEIEARAAGHRSVRESVRVVPGERASASVSFEAFECETPGMEHVGGADGGCCWPGQSWADGCTGTPECPDGGWLYGDRCMSPDTPPPGPPRLATFHFSVLGGVTNFARADTSLFRPGVAASGRLDSLGPRVELRAGVRLAGIFALDLTVGGAMQRMASWLDCPPGGNCAGSTPQTYTLDAGLLLTAHTNPPRAGGNVDFHIGIGARPVARIFFDDGGDLMATVIPAELGVSIYFADVISLDLLGQAELWVPWEYCGVDGGGGAYCLGPSALDYELAWSGLAGLTFHAD